MTSLPTYTLIQSATLTTSAATITLGSGGTIPQTYADLKLVASVRETSAQIDPTAYISFNGSSTNFSYKWLYGAGSGGYGSAGGSSNQLWDDNGSSATSNTFGFAVFYIPNYTNSNYKSFSFETIQENNGNYGSQILGAGLWSTSSAITSITLSPASGNFVTYSNFYLYGIKNS